MAITAFPFEDVDTSETQFSKLFRELQDTGVVGSHGDTSLRVSADSTGMNVKVSPGAVIVRGFFMDSTMVETLPIAPASPQPRIDLVVVRRDLAANTILPAVLTGTPAATTPQPPALTQLDTGIWEEPLAQVNVPASAATIAATNVTDVRRYVGGRVGVWTTATRPVDMRLGRLGFNTDSRTFEHYTGTAWATLPVPSHTHAASAITSGTLAVAQGGTGVASIAALRTALGLRTSVGGLHKGSTDSLGTIEITHGLGRLPTRASVVMAGQPMGTATEEIALLGDPIVWILAEDKISVRFRRLDPVTWFGRQPVAFYWEVS